MRGGLDLSFLLGYFLMKLFQFEENVSHLRGPRMTLLSQTLLGDRSFPCNYYKAPVLRLKSAFDCGFIPTSEEIETFAHPLLCTHILHNQFSAFSS